MNTMVSRMRHFVTVATISGALLFAANPNSYALVDLKGANFSDAWVDLIFPGAGYDLKVERAYNSRTLYNGMFGFGWCSDFETNLEITAEGNLKYSECGAGQETTYQSPGFSEKDVEKTVKNIIEKAKAENPAAAATYFSDLERRLHSESALRSEYASKFNITRSVADKTKFMARGKESDFVEKNGQYYVRVTQDGSTQKFTLKGKLEKIYDKSGNYLTLTYDGKLLKDVTDNNGRKLAFTYYDNGKVKTVTGPGGLKTEYKYKNTNDLISAKAATGNVYTYEYDDLHNMTKINFPDKTFKEMTYNKNMDWITSYRDVDGCLESYDYEMSKENPKDHFSASVKKTCQNKVILTAKYEFWYEFNSAKTEKVLRKSKTTENGLATEVAYNDLGKPLQMIRSGKTTKYEYFDNGLLKKKVTPDGVVTTLKYENPFKKVSRVTRDKKYSDFFYDAKGNLTRATNSDGQKITLAYDNRGRIDVLEDQAKRKILIKYEERFSKPSVIEREGMGTINVTYNNKGDIERVASAAGSAVAVQVASTFTNLLDLIQPAGVNLTF